MDNKDWKFVDSPIIEEETPDINVSPKQYDGNSFGDGTVLQSEKKKNKLIIPFIIVAIIAVIAVGCSIGLGIFATSTNNKIQELQSTIDTKEQQYDSLQSRYDVLKEEYDEKVDDYDELKQKYDFYDKGACVVDENSNYYHHLGCSHFDDSYYWIFNVEYAEYEGYRPCPYCWN